MIRLHIGPHIQAFRRREARGMVEISDFRLSGLKERNIAPHPTEAQGLQPLPYSRKGVRKNLRACS